MRRDPRDEGRRWLDQASRDLDDARYLRDGGRWSLACFHAQQAAEKALKGLLILRGVEDPWGHSVVDLAQLATSVDEGWRSWQVDVTGLDLYYIPTRYPDALPGGLPADAFGEEDAERALRKAQGVLDAVDRAFADSSDEDDPAAPYPSDPPAAATPPLQATTAQERNDGNPCEPSE